MKNILLITTVYRTGEKLYPIIPNLSKEYNIDVLHMYQMSSKTICPKEYYSRSIFDNRYSFYIRNEYNGPAYLKQPYEDTKASEHFIDGFKRVIKENNYCLVLWDNNTTIKGGGMSSLYNLFAKEDIKVLGSPHGNKEYKQNRLHKRMKRIYDSSFVFGEKEKEKFIKYSGGKFNDNFLPAGIPANDALINYERKNSYILIIPNYTNSSENAKSPFKLFTRELFVDSGLLKLSDKYGCKIVIKEKQSVFYENSYSVSDLFKKDGVEVISFCEDDNKLVADAKIVIGAPSTLSFKSIQLGIPTVIFNKYGAIGNFDDYPGVVDPSYNSILESVKMQMDKGRFDDYIKRTLSGGYDFKSIFLYIDYINRISNGEI